MTYPQKPESLKRPSLDDHPTSENPGYQIVQAVIPPEIAAQLQHVAEQCLDRWPDEETIAVCRVPYFWDGKRAGYIWCRFETCDNTNLPYKTVSVQTISGAEPWGYLSHGGFVQEDTAIISAKAIDHVAIVGGGEIISYHGKPFSPLFLPIEIPEWASDEGCTEYRLRQQELREEADQDE